MKFMVIWDIPELVLDRQVGEAVEAAHCPCCCGGRLPQFSYHLWPAQAGELHLLLDELHEGDAAQLHEIAPMVFPIEFIELCMLARGAGKSPATPSRVTAVPARRTTGRRRLRLQSGPVPAHRPAPRLASKRP